MRVTLHVRTDLLRKARELATKERRTLTSIIEEGLAGVLGRAGSTLAPGITLPVSRSRGGLLPGVDLTRTSDLEDRLSRE